MVHSHDFYTLYQTTYTNYTDLYGQQVCVFLQKGSFYELYGQQDPGTQAQLNTGKQVLEILGIVIHTYPADGPGGTTGFYGGVPVGSLTRWSEKLTTLGWTVVVIDEVKNGAGKVTTRKVSRVLSAGTHLEAAEIGVPFFLGSLWLDCFIANEPPRYGVAVADLTTGQVFLYEGQATGSAQHWHSDELRHFFQVHPPKELLLHVKGSCSTTIQDLEALRRTFFIPQAPIHVRQVTPESIGALESPTVREVFLRETFQPKTALPLRVWLHCASDGSSNQERALVAALRFAEDHAPKLASCLQAPTVWHPTQSLQVINSALTQLNLVGTVHDQLVVKDLFSEPKTPMGKRSLLGRLCSPIADSEQIQQRQMEIQWMLDLPPLQQKELETTLGLIYDIARIHRSILRGSLHAADCLNLHQSYQSAIHLWSIIQGSLFSASKTLLKDLQHCATQLQELFDIRKAEQAREYPEEYGFLQDSVGPKSAEAEEACAAVFEEANNWLINLRTLSGIANEQIYYKPTDKNEFCIHITKSAMTVLQRAVKQDSSGDWAKISFKSLTSAGRIEHPILDYFQQQLDTKRAYLKRCLAVELPAVCIQYAETSSCWKHLEDWIVSIDLSLTMAKTAMSQGWVRPTIEPCGATDVSRVQIQNLRHPLIEAQKRQSKYVTHDVSLGYDSSSGWLLYGMNASGKSSLMKAIGLAVLLAQVGSYVPATTMTLRPYKRLATRILNQDNLWAGLSSFAVEMSELREILAVADHQTLVLGDELCAGTESVSGTAIVAAGIQHLHKSRAQFVLATHLHSLMNLQVLKELPGLKVYHLHVEYDIPKDRLVYHRTLREGPGSTLYGLEVAKALHLPNDMIESAFRLRRELLGETAIEDSKRSSWSSDHFLRSCVKCGSKVAHTLEAHHLEERHEAAQGRNKDGQALHHIRNLATLCQGCHDTHHAEKIRVGPVEDTSDGPVRSILDLSQYAHVPKEPIKSMKKTTFTKEQLEAIQTVQETYPHLHTKLLVFQIEKTYGFKVTEAQLKQLRSTGSPVKQQDK